MMTNTTGSSSVDVTLNSIIAEDNEDAVHDWRGNNTDDRTIARGCATETAARVFQLDLLTEYV